MPRAVCEILAERALFSRSALDFDRAALDMCVVFAIAGGEAHAPATRVEGIVRS